jgi:hypothetical protein
VTGEQIGAWRRFHEGIFHGLIAQVVPLLHAVNTQHGFQRIGPATITGLGIHRLDNASNLSGSKSSILPRKTSLRVWRRLLENSLSAKVSCWLIRLLILGSGYNTMISHLGLIRTFLNAVVMMI